MLAPPAVGQARRDGHDLNESELTLQQKQRQLKEERAKVVQAKKREASVLAELEDTEKRLGDKRRQVGVLDERVKKAKADVAGLQGEIGRLEIQPLGAAGGAGPAAPRPLQAPIARWRITSDSFR